MYTENVARISCIIVIGENSHLQEQEDIENSIDMELKG
jgi:hypothetical protein